MKTFRCVCGNTLYFENSRCLACGRMLGFLPDRLELAALEPLGDDRYQAVTADGVQGIYRACLNYSREDACNWMVPEHDPEAYCQACRLNEVIPNLAKPGNRTLWIRIEQRKRRLVYELRRQQLPVVPRSQDPGRGLAFAFLEDQPGSEEFGDDVHDCRVLTGHANGLITINIAEADDIERERRRISMNEAQRTLLGHFRHESGHYYWDRLVAGGPLLNTVRACFGDERQDYASAIERYYAEGPIANWQASHVSAYASAHPWEDWAECWAHWLQITDTLETAVAIGMAPGEMLQADVYRRLDQWAELALGINLLSRSLDQPDPYPFVLSPPVIDKLAVIDQVIRNSGFTP